MPIRTVQSRARNSSNFLGLGYLRNLRTALGFDDDPLDDIRSAQMIETTRQANIARVMTQDRQEREFAYKRESEGYKTALSQMTKIHEKLPPGAQKEHMVQMMKALWFNAPPRIRALMQGTSYIRPISPEEERRTFFLQTHSRPRDLLDVAGQPLPYNEESADSINVRRYQQLEFDHQLTTVVHGVAKAKELSPRPDVYVAPPFRDKENKEIKGSNPVYFRDKHTKQIVRTGLGLTQIDIDQARDWGYSVERMAALDFGPTAEPIVGIEGGARIEVTPGMSLKDGSPKWNKEYYGTPDSAVTGIPKSWKDAIGWKRIGVDADDKRVKSGETAGIMKMLKDFEGAYSKEQLKTNQGLIDQEVAGQYPDIPYSFTYDDNELEHPLIFYRNKYKVKGSNWLVTPRMRTVQLTDSEDKVGTLKVDENGKLHDPKGTPIKETADRAVEDGDRVPEITFRQRVKRRIDMEDEAFRIWKKQNPDGTRQEFNSMVGQEQLFDLIEQGVEGAKKSGRIVVDWAKKAAEEQEAELQKRREEVSRNQNPRRFK